MYPSVDSLKQSLIIGAMSKLPTVPDAFNKKSFTKALRSLLEQLPADASEASNFRGKVNGAVLRDIRSTLRRLHRLHDQLDSVWQPVGRIELFAPATIGRLIGRELVSVARIPLGQVENFYGAGVYAIYYTGDHPAYAAIKETNCPIYVGKGDSKYLHAQTPRDQGRGIFLRLRKHRSNIELATDLDIDDFDCRYLATESGWQMTAESFLITLYRPVWNKEIKVCQGFGKHGDIARTELSKWDVLHTGRKWASSQKARRGYTIESVTRDIEEHFIALLNEDPGFWRDHLNAEWIATTVRNAHQPSSSRKPTNQKGQGRAP